MALSLYVHIPFCLKRCIYCDFVSGVYDPEKADAYIKALKKEISNIAGAGPFSTLYIGGGTPTALSASVLTDLINHIFSHFKFEDNYEATIEVNPGTIDKEKLQVIRSLGINRISIGIQSFNDRELAFLGRIHSSQEAEQAVYSARDAGFENIGTDLIYGIPGQDMVAWKKTLETTVLLKPEHISTYELTVEEDTMLYKRCKGQEIRDKGQGSRCKMLSEENIVEMYEYTIDYLRSHGYTHYEISNFALPDCQSRHNLNYWDRGGYYGTGLGAHSFIKGNRYCNTDNLDAYLRAFSENKSSVKESEYIAEDKVLSESLFLGLRKTVGINIESFSKRYKINVLSHYQNEIRELQEAGLIEIVSSGCSYETILRLTRKGLLLSNEVFARLI